MRPLQVIMHAFGPYKDRVNVDFNALNEKGLFAITGPTGAGKTTIFDGICFALYGEASGENRNDQSLLRSHFADDEIYTSVELTFELKGKQYNIFRQKGHQKKQNKGITGDKIEFYKIENEEKVPYCQEFNKTTIVNKKVEELLGINADQFKQIVLLPQGEFRKLLVSDTKEKEEILRKIFKTELYDKVKDKIGIARSNMENSFRNLKQKIVIKLEAVEGLLQEKGINITEDAQINLHIVKDLLNEKITNVNQELKQLEESELNLKELLETQKQKLFTAETHNKNIKRLQEINELLALLKDQEVLTEEKKIKLQFASRAEKVLPFKTEVDKLKNNYKLTNEKLAIETENLQKILQELNTISLEVAALPDKKKILLNLENHYTNLLALKESIESFRSNEAQLVLKNEQFNRVTNEEKSLQSDLKQVNEEYNQLKNDLAQYEGTYEQWAETTLLKQQVHQKGTFAKRIVLGKNEFDQKRNDYQSNHVNIERLQTKLSKIEHEMVQQKAAYLAKDLNENQECPVCGSTHHPTLAKFIGSVNEEDAIKLKEEVTLLQNQLATKLGELKSLESTNQQNEQSFIEEYGQFDFSKEGLIDLGNDFKQIESNLKLLTEKKETLERIQQSIKNKEQLVTELTNKLTGKIKEVTDCTNDLNELKLKIVQIESKLPESIRTYEQWQVEMNDCERNSKSLRAEIVKIEEYHKALSEQKTIKETTCAHLEQDLTRLSGEIEKAKVQYEDKLKENQFYVENDFIQAKEFIPSIEQLRNEITLFEENNQRLNTEKELLQNQVTSTELIDEEEIKVKLQEINLRVDNSLNEIIRLQELNKRLIQLNDELQIYQEEFVKKEKLLAGLNDLYKVTKGDNDKMISFERYVLLDYFEQIIESANIRLDHLSNGQFQLQRKETVEKGRKQSGLGLEVYDSYTGLARDVKTLSGGEQFNASLCLALGMADIIQAHQGGVSIDTLFIDEGFGSLDEELLSKAIDTLIQLQKSGRLIGVISHVQDVKDAMPAVIEVHKTNHGFSEISILIK
ncbi:AAA family ATPase [Bacillus sp. EAC]|uniref:AAA family ATPase n=1 Tax=Bacillus sp. EAC TaxID=1978338 RepID=UPI000B444EE0|nr:SbcC/MukB-like Walker B domain-containing protein [Bacillus sp. EAC]